MAARPPFTPAEAEVIRRAALRVWDEVGYDCLQATADDEGVDVEAAEISRDVVLEIVCDAGRLEERLRRDGHADLAERWRDLGGYPTRHFRVLRPAFPYARYGL